MSKDKSMNAAQAATRRRLTIERTWKAPIEDVWALWTTKEGIESWWGPEGFTVTVHTLDLRAGGEITFAMTATAPEQVAFMKQAGMPVTTETRLIYTEVAAPRRLAFRNPVDFIPGVAPYDVETEVALTATDAGVRMVLTFDAMHDAEWTERMVQGRNSELVKLARVLGA
jgi:uncharacterized protein YndB with AHSA1/START domain